VPSESRKGGRVSALAIALVSAGPASAIVVRLANGKEISYEAVSGTGGPRQFDELFQNVDYNGGPVMPSNTNYTLYWDPSGAPAYPAEYKSGVNAYLEDLAHDSGGHQNVDSVSTQYNDSEGQFANYDSHFGGELVDELVGAGVLPHDRVVHRVAGAPVPHHSGLPLVGDTHGSDVARRQVRLGQCPGGDLPGVGPHLGRIVLHPAGPGQDLPVLALVHRHHPAVVVEHHGAGGGGALVDRCDVLAHRQPR